MVATPFSVAVLMLNTLVSLWNLWKPCSSCAQRCHRVAYCSPEEAEVTIRRACTSCGAIALDARRGALA